MHVSISIHENDGYITGGIYREVRCRGMYGHRTRGFDPSDYFQWFHCSYRNCQYADEVKLKVRLTHHFMASFLPKFI
jgi:hypothetical protein